MQECVERRSEYDGGHRVPFFLHWSDGGMDCKHVVKTLCHAVDVAPTLLELTGSTKPRDNEFDGQSIAALLKPGAQVEGLTVS